MSTPAFYGMGSWIHMCPIALASHTLLLLVLIACTTRFISGWTYSRDLSSRQDTRRVATIPYWYPYFGHLLPALFHPTRFLQTCRQQSPAGIFALRLLGSKHNIVWTPSLIDAIFKQSDPALSASETRWAILCNVFGADRTRKGGYLKAHQDAHSLLVDGLSNESECSQIVQTTLDGIQEHAPNMLSFSERITDQNPWERDAYPVVRGHAVEVSMFTLVRNFVGHISLPSLVGTEFIEAYPTTLDDLWDLDSGFKWMALGFSRLLGIPSLTRAHIARRRLLHAMHSFHRALDCVVAGNDELEQPWRDLSDVGGIMKERSAAWLKNGTIAGVKAPCDLSLLWAMSTKPSYLVFWMLIRIWTTPGLVQEIRDEISPFAEARQRPQVFAIPEPPRLEIDLHGLENSCPLLKACFYECLRLYSTSTSARWVKKRMVVHEAHGGLRAKAHSQAYALEAGSRVIVPFSLHHHNPRYFWKPYDFQLSRFLKPSQDGQSQQSIIESKLQPWGGGESCCPGRKFAEKEILAFVAGLLALWDFEPTSNDGWIIPDQSERNFVSVAAADIRVRVQPRRLPGGNMKFNKWTSA